MFNATETLTPAFGWRLAHVNFVHSFWKQQMSICVIWEYLAKRLKVLKETRPKSSRHFNLHEQSWHKHSSFQPSYRSFCTINHNYDCI